MEAAWLRRAREQDDELEALEEEQDRASAKLRRLRDEARGLQADISAGSGVVQKLETEARARAARVHALEQELQELRVQVNVTEDSNAALASGSDALLAQENDARGRYVLQEVARAQAEGEVEALGAAKDEVLGNISRLEDDVDRLKERLSLFEGKTTATRGTIRLLDTAVKDELEENRRREAEAAGLRARVQGRESQAFQLLLQSRTLEQDKDVVNRTAMALVSENDRLRESITKIDRICNA